MPGGFHPFHAGHAELYRSAVKAFPDAQVYVAATNDTKTRPFPFAIKEKLAKLAGVADKHFVQVKSPFKAEEITSHYNPNEDVLIFVRSEKDRNEQPKPGGTKKDGSPSYFQPYTGKDMQPFGKHAYIAYLPTVEFGPGIKSATEIRNAWPKLDDRRKTAMVMSLYPVTQKNPKLAANVVKMLDMGMGNELAEDYEDDEEHQGTTEHYNGIEISLEVDNDEVMVTAMMANGREMGHVLFVQEGNYLMPQDLEVEERYQGQGIAATMYDYVKSKGYKIRRSGQQTDAGAGFWDKHRPNQNVWEQELDEGPFVSRIGRPNKVNIYLRHDSKKPAILVATDIPYSVYDKFIAKAMQKYPRFNQTDFSFKSADRAISETNLSESADYLEEK